MPLNLKKSIKSIISETLSPSYFSSQNGLLNHQPAAIELPFTDLEQITPRRRPGRGLYGQQMRISDGSSLPLPRLLYHPHDCSLYYPPRQIPFILPHASTLYPFQKKLPLDQNPYHAPLTRCGWASILPRNGNFVYLHYRIFSAYSASESESDAEGEGEGSDSVEVECESANSKVDPEEADRVCKIIDELFALDRNMEAVLDGCGINLTHDLVVDVLKRYQHARKPAFRFFCWAGQRPGFDHDSRTYNSMMTILGKTRQFETMVAMLDEMGEKCLLTMETFEIAIRTFAAAQERKKAVAIFELMKKHKYKVGVDMINCLLDALGRAKLGKEAQSLFEKLKPRFTPNLQTYTVLINGWCKVKNLMEAGKLWNEMIDNGFKPDIVAHNTMLEGLLRGKKMSDAIKLFEVMKSMGPSPNVRSYTILIRYLCKQGKMTLAVEFFEEMLNSGCELDVAVYTCLITGFGNQKKMDKVYGLLKEMKDKGCPPDSRMYNALIKLMTNRRMPDDAVMLYKKMVGIGIEPTVHTYNMMMKSYFQARNYEMARATWEEMNRKGCCPDDNSYVVFIGGLIREGRSGEACKYLEEMMEKGMKAPQLDYNKFAADFSRAGKIDILKELAQKMRFSGKFEVSGIFSRWAGLR